MILKSFQRSFLAVILAVLALTLFLTLLRPIRAAPPLWPLLVPVKLTINPISNTHTAPRTSTVSIVYSENINLATVSTQTFAVHAMQTGLRTQTYGVAGGAISLTPAMPFKPGELVQVSATTGTLNLNGQGPLSSTIWQFWIAVDEGSGIFTDSGQSLGIAFIAAGDVDGDSDLDAYLGKQVWLNDGGGNFTDSGQHLSNNENIRDVALGDLNGDGDLDAFVANGYDFFGGIVNDTVWLNDGTGSFSDSGQRLGDRIGSDVDLGDLDGDGDLDAFVGNVAVGVCSPPKDLWLNDGTGVFTASNQSLGRSNSVAVALGDMDGDSDLDAFVGNRRVLPNPPFCGSSKGPDEVWLNNGTGIFTDSGQRLDELDTQSVALGDVDADGDLDAFAGHDGPNQLWLNNGVGIFTDSGQNLGENASSVAFGDVDADGDLDVFIGKVGPDQILLNNGTGVFTDSGQRLGNSSAGSVALGDVNGDGDLDALVGNGDQANQVWLNLNFLYLPIILKEL